MILKVVVVGIVDMWINGQALFLMLGIQALRKVAFAWISRGLKAWVLHTYPQLSKRVMKMRLYPHLSTLSHPQMWTSGVKQC